MWLKLFFCLVLISVASLSVAAETTVLRELRLEPNTLCAGDSTLLFVELENDGKTIIRDASLRIFSPSLGLWMSEHVDIPIGRTTRAMQFSTPRSIGDYGIVVELSNGQQEALSEVLHVISCTPAAGVPVLLVPPQQDSKSVNDAMVAGIVGIQLVVVLVAVFVAYLFRQKNVRSVESSHQVKPKKAK